MKADRGGFYGRVRCAKSLILLGHEAGRAIGFLFMMGLVGKLFSGIFADRFSHRTLMAASLLLMIAGAVGLASFVSQGLLLWVVAFGLGWGAFYTLIQIATVSSFGTVGSGRILGAIAVLEALGGGLGPWLIGLTFDKTGSYAFGFSLIAAGLAVAFVMSRLLPDATQFGDQPRLHLQSGELQRRMS